MYLSKILISGPACRNPYDIHRVLWRLFPEEADAHREFLFRVGHSERNHAEVLLQSERKPVRSSEEAKILAWKEFPLSLHVGQCLRFFLIANPIKTIDDEGGRKNVRGDTKKCRVPLISDEDRQTWIKRKFQDAASIEVLAIDPLLPLRFRKGKEDRAGKIQPVSFQGVLNVKNPAILSELIQNGIGPAKAFGCGLISLTRT